MGHFTTSVAVMQKAVNDIVAAKQLIDKQLSEICGAAEGTIKGWQGSGGNTLRVLMGRYDGHARSLQSAIDAFQMMLADQAKQYGINDEDASVTLRTAAGGLKML